MRQNKAYTVNGEIILEGRAYLDGDGETICWECAAHSATAEDEPDNFLPVAEVWNLTPGETCSGCSAPLSEEQE